MKFTQKRTCKGCAVSGESICTVEKASVNDGSPFSVPHEPCFKPKTSREWSEFIRVHQYMQANNIEILRLKEE